LGNSKSAALLKWELEKVQTMPRKIGLFFKRKASRIYCRRRQHRL